ncbi:MAG: LacI family DNA-binding transcriptional regulator [Oscillospiraceae bacterium]
MRVTIKQIAELSNVSRGTVDRVLNNRSGVKPEVRQRIRDIAEALKYKPNILGKALVGLAESLKIGVILTPDNNPFIDEVKLGIQSAVEEYNHYGIEVIIRTLPSLDPMAQLLILDEMEQMGINAVAMIPLDDNIIRERINALAAQSIPIITFNSRIENVDELCFVGQNHTLGGTCAGGLMGKLLPSGGDIGVIISSKTLACHIDRLNGFSSRLEERYPDIHIVSVMENADQDDLAFDCALRMLNEYPELGGIYITGGGIVGLGKAVKILKKNASLKIISHDFVDGTAELLKAGILDFAIGQNPHLQGYLLIRLFFDFFVKNELPTNKNVEIPVEIATEDNIFQSSLRNDQIKA